MSLVNTFTTEGQDGTTTEWATIDNGLGWTIMTKAAYEAQQAAQVAPQA
jgi:hypothetical protein